jgi:NADP-dependent 3-hydroxy acid dehydrogenase YdfG
MVAKQCTIHGRMYYLQATTEIRRARRPSRYIRDSMTSLILDYAPPDHTPSEALPPSRVAALIVWIAAAPSELVLNEVIVSPLKEQGWP